MTFAGSFNLGKQGGEYRFAAGCAVAERQSETQGVRASRWSAWLVPFQSHLVRRANRMNIEAPFAKLTPAAWTQTCGLRPIERARHFAVPMEEDIGRVALAMTLVGEIIGGKQNAAGVRWKSPT